MDPFDFSFGENLGGAADYGTGFGQPFGAGVGTPPPMMPWTGGFPGQDLGDPAASFAAGLAAKGIRPQQFLANPQAAMPVVGPPLPALRSDWDPTPVGTPGGVAVGAPAVGASMTDEAGMVAADPANAQAAAKPADKEGDKAKQILEALRGIKMPVAPQAQTIRTPQAPQPHAVKDIKGGQLIALLQALGANPGAGKIPALGGMLRG